MTMTVSIRNNQLNLFAGRTGYNLALRHFRVAQELAADVDDGYNLANLLNRALEEGRIEESQIAPITNILLVEKYGYAYRSDNLKKPIENIEKLNKTSVNWSNIQVVFAFTDNNGGKHVLNPETLEEWNNILPLPQDSHIACYVGSLEKVDTEVLEKAVSDVFSLLYNSGSVRSNARYKSSGKQKQFARDDIPAKKEAGVPVKKGTASEPVAKHSSAVPGDSGSKKLTLKVGVNVTNELFHNGNVEAWKRIIQSYRVKYPHLDVLIWYEGERIMDINALFKWGKVKHGVPIMFSVTGEGPAEISKLRKYLYEGASPRFEAFLHGGPGTVLKLF